MNYFELSKEVSYALRHAPWEYELEMDEDGWVSVDQLLEALKLSSRWMSIEPCELEVMVSQSDKKRHEIVDGKIRAFYGHSVPQKILKNESHPPQKLYHGTMRSLLHPILREGLKPNQRQYVHLSQDIETAVQVGKRRDDEPIIFEINAELAYVNGVKFYFGNEMVWLADYIPPEFLNVIEK